MQFDDDCCSCMMALRTFALGFILIILLCSSLASSGSDSGCVANYTSSEFCVTPEISTPCNTAGIQYPCLTLNDYVHDTKQFFLNDSTFYFSPGNHHLNVGLNLTGVHNVSFLGYGAGGVTLIVDQLTPFMWRGCKDIEITNITFSMGVNFGNILAFHNHSSVVLSNVTILGNGHAGCSSIISEHSEVKIVNSNFIGINGYLGAALSAFESNITIGRGSIFINNTALAGGAIYLYSSLAFFVGTNTFLRNTASLIYHKENDLICKKYFNTPRTGTGGAVYCFNSSLESIECSVKSEVKSYCSLMNQNSRSIAFDADNNSIDHCEYAVNSSRRGGDPSCFCGVNYSSSACVTQPVVIFHQNRAHDLGGALLLFNTSLSFCGKFRLESNSASVYGGAIYLISANLSFQSICTVFYLNTAKFGGGSIYSVISYLQLQGNIRFYNNSADLGGALRLDFSSFQYFLSAVSVRNETSKYLCGHLCLVNNAANSGGAIYMFTSNISFSISCGSVSASTSSKKGASYDDVIHYDNCMSTVLRFSTVIFRNNEAKFNGGSIFSRSSHLYFMGTVLFEDNIADYGGAMYLCKTSQLILKQLLSVVFTENIAHEKGGAILLQKSYSECFFTIDASAPKSISLEFANNSASAFGGVLYLMQVDSCERSSYNTLDSCKVKIGQNYTNWSAVFRRISTITSQDHVGNMSADVEYIRFCSDPLKGDSRYKNMTLYPGQQFNVTLVAIGPAQLFVETEITRKVIDVDIRLRRELPRTAVNTTCTNVFYRLFATKAPKIAKIQLYHDNSCNSHVDSVYLNVTIQPCPFGFELSTKEQKCICDKRLQTVTDKCIIDKLAFNRNGNTFWISKINDSAALLLYRFGCPFGYCKDKPVSITLNDSDVQCYGNRSGVLCGQCREMYSLALGSLHCLKCTSKSYIALILPFASTGVVLVILIFLLHLTVDVGTLNGLTFYVNIIQANRQTFFPSGTVNLFTVFIAWMNLDFGIESCFLVGMDIYVYSWLQFVFPFYIWCLIAAIIVVCHYSKKASKRLGQNPVTVLATLLFVSYGKILNAIVTPLSMSQINVLSDESSSVRHVWLYDGSIEFFKTPKHIVLGLFAGVTLIILFFPYTFILLFGHWLLVFSDKWCMSWLNKIKPFMDAHYAPYRQKARYWIGLSLLARLSLLLTVAMNAVGSDSVNILVISSITAGLLAIKRRVYENNYNDLLESSFILNLCVLSIVTFYLKEENIQEQHQVAVSNTSIGISFVTFLGILLFHSYLPLKSTHLWKNIVIPTISKSPLLCKMFRIAPVKNEEAYADHKSVDLDLGPPVSSSVVELREPLLEADL